MRRALTTATILLLSSTAVSSQVTPAPTSSTAASQQVVNVRPPDARVIDRAIADWRVWTQMRTISDPVRAAQFALAYPDWPGIYNENGGDSLRLRTERAFTTSTPPRLVTDFFKIRAPQTANGWAVLARAYRTEGRESEALSAARNAWAHPDLDGNAYNDVRQLFGNQLTSADHDKRIDALLFQKEVSRAEGLIPLASPARRAVFEARVALQRRDASRYNAVSNRVTSDAGLMMDRARYLRSTGQNMAAQSLLAQEHRFEILPTDLDKWYEMLLLAANEAADRGAWTTAFNISRQLDDAYPLGTDLKLQPYGVRDKFTSLAWLAGRTAMDKLDRKDWAAKMFDAYSQGGRSLQVESKGLYWAGRALAEAGQPQRANAYFERAAAYPDLFYGQLALERLGREIPVPPSAPIATVSPEARQAFYTRPIVAALPRLVNDRDTATKFVRAMSESLDSRDERLLAFELGRRIDRPDIGVWIARSARNAGTPFYYREAFPVHPAGVRGGEIWSVAHGITRQESSFDRSVVSHANAHGMMQIIPSTGREWARKVGLPYSTARLTQDPTYNVTIGTAYIDWLIRYWDGNVPLAAASYNGGMGNVQKWVNRYGDPRTNNVDTLEWIEQIPFGETRGYVQRVVENAAVYDRLNPYVPRYGPVHVSRHLGKSNRPG
ncbi:lytic transglycosylase domain-containing protein [Sphingomicrobium clamense]|uniref:Lytic transglycosylase domain-containing protein n=1 Tax=Sphingomicrobium clamense TaxID=2851013 RepID=A0ABS6V7F5_9SPHN|nr:lytic transglycosylase domain-containing protein [Sphingomicrobium sp. B8]MBW0144998.1 lytic transglycosylase domain-containing protein [Sphingomicrobium sp. B8]